MRARNLPEHAVCPSSGYEAFEHGADVGYKSCPTQRLPKENLNAPTGTKTPAHNSAPAALPKQILNLVRPRVGSAVRPKSANNDDQVKLLEQLASSKIDKGETFAVLGQSFNARAVQEFQDERAMGDVDVFNEVDAYGMPTGKSTVVLEHDPSKPHRGSQDSLLQGIRAAVRPHLASILDELVDAGETSLHLQTTSGIPMGQITPDLAVYATPTLENALPVLIGQVSFKHETLEELFMENKIALDYSSVKSAWAIDVTTSRQPDGWWKLPKLSIFILQRVGTRLYISGPKAFGAGTRCIRAGIEEFQAYVRGRHLLQATQYPSAQDLWMPVDLYSQQQLIHNLLRADGGLGDEQQDRGFTRRHKEVLYSLAEQHDVLPQERITTRAQLDAQLIRLQSD